MKPPAGIEMLPAVYGMAHPPILSSVATGADDDAGRTDIDIERAGGWETILPDPRGEPWAGERVGI